MKSTRNPVNRHLRGLLTAGAAATLVVGLTGCGGGSEAVGSDGMPSAVTIGYQPGLSYAPLLILKQTGTLEKQFPNTKFTWKKLSSSAAVQDGMISGDIQVGAGSAPQLILAWDKGIKWHYLASMNDAELWLMAKDPKFKSLKDFTSSDKIAMPSPTSIQALVLRKGALDQLGKPTALDTNIVPMGHPDGVQNLISGQISAHLTSPPFEFQEKEQGAHVVFKSTDAFGKTMFNGVFLMDDYYKQNTKFANAFYTALKNTTDQINSDPASAAKALAEDAGGKTSAAQFQKDLTNPAITFTVEPHGLEKLAGFMKQIGITTKTPGSWKDLTFPPAQATSGS